MIPLSFLSATLPFNVIEWYKNLEQHLIEIYQTKKSTQNP